ncbi:hypothetical protein [Antribacter gilvus]|uniref:hypothetical protein n=1 Tax=Antribacter gilvus TaxID=2304675 RepID=UPI000F792F2A|nr:hypothetical protein [Antribacter gilvus]
MSMPRIAGDTNNAKRYAQFLTAFCVASLLLGALMVFGWWNAQVNGYTGDANPRGFVLGSPFPWSSVVASVLASGITGRFAVVKWRRYAALRREDRRPLHGD